MSPSSDDAREVAGRALAHHRLRVRRVVRAAQSYNSVFRVEADEGTFALRVPAALRIHPPGTLDIECAWLDGLHARGHIAPVPVQDEQGRYDTVIETASGSVECALFTWVPGRSLRSRLSGPKAVELGRLAAELHADGAAWQHDHLAGALKADTATYWQLPHLLTTPSTPFHGVLAEARLRVQEVIDDLWADPPHPPHLLHGDLHPANTVVTSSGGLAAIDFQDVVCGFEVQDLAITISALRRHPGGDRLTEAFTAGYASHRPWPPAELLEAMVAARILNQLNLGMAVHGFAGREDQLAARATALHSWLDAPGEH